MFYVVRCHHCPDVEVWCNEPGDDQQCPACGRTISHYHDVDGKVYCWLHREPIATEYRISPNWLTTHYLWSGQEHRFPHAKLFPDRDTSPINEAARKRPFGVGKYCEPCERVYEEWRTARRCEKPAIK